MKSVNKDKRTIESILDLETGNEIKAVDFFSQSIDKIFKYRYEIETHIRENKKRYVCYFCKQNIKIVGQRNSKRILYFAHLKDSDECPIKTGNNFTKREIERIKYNGAKESELHIYLKNQIALYLSKNEETKGEISDIRIEKVRKDKAIPKKWKKPDVSATFKGKTIVFELQLSTTFLSVINDRQEFYKKNKTYILWVFNHFEEKEDKRKFTQSDIFYNNNRNGFEFDKKAQELSKIKNDLILNCHYEQPIINKNLEIGYVWKQDYISLSQLTFDENYKLYYFDVEKEEKKLLKIIEEQKKELEIQHSDFINSLKSKDLNKLLELFQEKNLTINEYEYLKKLYNKNISGKKNIEYESEDFLTIWTLILYKIKRENFIEKIIDNYPLKKVIIDLLSLKINKIIGYKYEKQVQIAHLLLQRFPQYKNYYLKGIEKWKTINLDKEWKLKNKIRKIDDRNIEQIENCEIIELIFPELK